MSVYHLIVNIVKALLYLINGKPQIIGLEKLPNHPVIIASTHRSFLDPVYIVILSLPKPVAFMAKKSLFEIPIIGYLIKKVNAFPINREKTSTQSLRHAVKVLQEDNMHLGIFPTGSRYATEVKSGTAFIQRMSKADILPVAIQPPLTLKDILLRRKGKIALGQVIPYDEKLNYNKETLKNIDDKIAREFERLDKIIDPNYTYLPPQKKEVLFSDKEK